MIILHHVQKVRDFHLIKNHVFLVLLEQCHLIFGENGDVNIKAVDLDNLCALYNVPKDYIFLG